MLYLSDIFNGENLKEKKLNRILELKNLNDFKYFEFFLIHFN